MVLLSTVLFLSSSSVHCSIDENNRANSNRFSIQVNRNSIIDQSNSLQILHVRFLNSRLMGKIKPLMQNKDCFSLIRKQKF